MEILDLYGLDISVYAVSELLCKAPNIKAIKLHDCKNVTDLDLKAITTFSHLESLDLSDLAISAKAVRELLCKAPNIREIKLRDCKNLTDLDLTGIPKLTMLEKISVQYLFNLMVEFLQQAPQLKKNIDMSSIIKCICEPGQEKMGEESYKLYFRYSYSLAVEN